MALQTKCASLNYYLILLFVFVKLSLSEDLPIIDGDPEQIIKSGDTFVVTCEGNFSDLTWTLHPHTDINYSNDSVYTTRNQLPDFAKKKYISKLKIVNATYIDTGEYKCYSESKPEYQRSMYLFVQDEKHLSVYTEFKTGMGTQFNPHTIPCLPTSPDIRVTLHTVTDQIYKIPLNVMDKDGTFVRYDNHRGFITNKTLIIGDVVFVCTFEKGGYNESLDYVLIIEDNAINLSTPEIIDVSGGHTIVGMDLILKCVVESSVDVTFKWTTPSHTSQITRGEQTAYNNTQRQQTLTIHNAREIDSGEYSCSVNDYQNHASNNSINVPVYRKSYHFLKLFEENGLYKVSQQAGPEYVQWRITVQSHPVATLKWLGPNNEQIFAHNNKHETSFSAEHAFLKINNIQLSDYGKYTLLANNSVENQSIEVFLNVTDKPSKPIIRQNAYHFINEPCQFQCRVAANPEPTITWSYKKCLEPSKCNFVNISKNLSHIERHGMHLFSNLTLEKCSSGQIKCKALNYLGNEETTETLFVSDVKNGFDIFGWDSSVSVTSAANTKQLTVAVGESLQLTCGAFQHDFHDKFSWHFNGNPLQYDDKYAIVRGHTEYSFRSNLKVESINFADGGRYVCLTENRQSQTVEKEVVVRVQTPFAPYLNATNMKKPIEMEFPKSLQLFCKISGMPKPKITWYKNEAVLYPGGKLTFKDFGQILYLNYTDLNDEGTYKCEASNKIGTVSRTTSVSFKNKPHNEINKYGIGAIVILCTFVVLCVIVLCIKIRNEKKLQRELQIAGLANFEKGALENINPDLGLDDQAELLPYDKKWEFPIEKLKLGKQLGSGAFGVVMRGEAKEICEDEEVTTVAVKMVKRNADSTYIKALASELKIMVHLGKHLNVVNLLGAVTKNVGKRELMVIVEFCRFGNLQNYILRHRENFINQVDPRSGNVDFNIGLEVMLERSYSVSSSGSAPRSPLKYAALSFSNNSRKIPEDMIDYRGENYVSNTADTGTTMVYMAPTGSTGEEGVVLSNNSIQPEWRSNYRGDYKGNVKPICTKDLLAWSFQVARGMEYLASRKVLHGDLAARNILLADNNVVKICDFGLAKSMYNNDNYKKKGDGPLPVKWMAIESIRDRVFSTQSDVWSFGIVLWEFFSLARTPYPGMEADERLYQKLVEGYRMEPPEDAPNSIVKMMSDCWLAKPLLRPSFTKLSERLGSMLEDSVRKYYIDLNDPYLLMNTQRLEDGRSDYLAMFSPPNFENLSSPHDYANSLPPLTSPELTPGYLCMQHKNIFSPRAEDSNNEVFDFNNVTKNNKNSAEAQGTELVPMLHPASESDCDSSVCNSPNLAPNSFSNPSYHIPPNVQQENDIKCLNNYINMAQNKTAIKDKIINNSIKNDQIKNINDYVNSSARDWESVNV